MRATVFSTGEAFVSGQGASGEEKAFRINFAAGSQLLEIEDGASVSLGKMIRSNSSYQVLNDVTLPKIFTAMREYPLLSGVIDNFSFAFMDELGPEIQTGFFREFEPALSIPHLYSEAMRILSNLYEEKAAPLVPRGSYHKERLHTILRISGFSSSLRFVLECDEKGIV
jgi:hypothetical protein